MDHPRFIISWATLSAHSHGPLQVHPLIDHLGTPSHRGLVPLHRQNPRSFPVKGLQSVDLVDTVQTVLLQGMKECYELGLTKAIGLSNFNSVQLQRVLDNCRIKPANLQVPSSLFSLKIILHKLGALGVYTPSPLVQTKMVGALLFRGIPDQPLNYLYRLSVSVTVVI